MNALAGGRRIAIVIARVYRFDRSANARDSGAVHASELWIVADGKRTHGEVIVDNLMSSLEFGRKSSMSFPRQLVESLSGHSTHLDAKSWWTL
jgi:hypothetical protein